MFTTTVEGRFRTFLLVLAGCICIGTVVELWLTEHTDGPLQLLPFLLCGAGLLTVIVALLRPRQWTLLGLRLVMALLLAGSLLGIFHHIDGNYHFELEMRPNATASEVWIDALKGANPILAPGVLGLAAVLALASTYAHPALARPVNRH